jgi:hypothetical protein
MYLNCPNLCCRKVLALPEESRGTKVRCGVCGMVFAVPKEKLKKPGSATEVSSPESSPLSFVKNKQKKTGLGKKWS